jgi:hypothetical protein
MHARLRADQFGWTKIPPQNLGVVGVGCNLVLVANPFEPFYLQRKEISAVSPDMRVSGAFPPSVVIL